MTDTASRLPPVDDPGDLSSGDVFREVLFFAAVVGTVAGGGYGLFAGIAEYRRALAASEPKSILSILGWGGAWALGGGVGVAVLGSLLAGMIACVGGVVRKLRKR